MCGSPNANMSEGGQTSGQVPSGGGLPRRHVDGGNGMKGSKAMIHVFEGTGDQVDVLKNDMDHTDDRWKLGDDYVDGQMCYSSRVCSEVQKSDLAPSGGGLQRTPVDVQTSDMDHTDYGERMSHDHVDGQMCASSWMAVMYRRVRGLLRMGGIV